MNKPKRITFLRIITSASLCLYGSIASAEPPEVDLVALLTESQLTPQTLSDGIWMLTPPKGRRLMLIPFAAPTRLAEPVSVNDATTKLSGGQFVAWHIPAPAPGQNQRGQSPPQDGQLSLDPPRLTREAEFRPDGTVHWALTRGLPGGSVSDAKQLYALMIDRKLLDPPRQRDRNAPRLDAEERRQQIAHRASLIAALREAPDEFTGPSPATIYAVYYVPESLPRFAFVGADPLPWAVPYTLFEELRTAVKSTNDPKEWRPLLEHLVAGEHAYGMRVAAAFLAANGNISKLDENSLLVPLIEKLVTAGGPVTRRMLVDAVAHSDKPTPVAGPMLDAVMGDADGWVALAAMRARVNDAGRRKQPLTDDQLKTFAATATRLLAAPGGHGSPPVAAVLAPALELSRQNESHLIGLGDRMQIHQVPESRRGEMIAAVLAAARQGDPLASRWVDKELLSPADAKLAAATLQQIISTPLRLAVPKGQAGYAAAASISAGQPGQPQEYQVRRSGGAIVSGLLGTVPGAAVPEQSLPTAVGPTGVEVAPRSTPAPAQAVEESRGFWSLVDRIAATGGDDPQPTSAAQPTYGQPTQPLDEPAEPDQPYPLDSPEHNLLKLLAAGDDPLRELAWTALPRFTVATSRGVATGGGQQTSLSQQRLTETYHALADVAGALDPTPQTIVPFLKAQPDRAGVEAGMQRLLAKANGPSRIAAMLHIATAGPQPLITALNAMSPDERVAVAALWYSTAFSIEDRAEGAEPSPPLVLGLLRHTEEGNASSRVVQWFAQQVAEGRRPAASAWAQAVGSDELLITGLTDPDERYALGCAAAIIGTVMPPDEPMAQQLRQVAADIAAKMSEKEEVQREMQLRWAELRQLMVNERLNAAAGPYSVTLRIMPTERTPRTDPAKLRPVKHELGEVEMMVSKDGKVTFTPTLTVTVTDRPLSLKFSNPQELTALPAAVELKLKERGEAPSVALDLLPDRQGRWSASTILPDQRSIRLILTPKR